MDQMKIYRVEQKNEEPVEVQIIRSSRRSMGLQVKADGTVCARVPMQVMDYAVQEFIEGHADWIFKKIIRKHSGKKWRSICRITKSRRNCCQDLL